MYVGNGKFLTYRPQINQIPYILGGEESLEQPALSEVEWEQEGQSNELHCS